MNKPKEIIVDIATDGSIKIEGNNFTGASCVKATAFLEKALGVAGASTKKREYNEKQVQQHQQKASQ